MTPRRPERDCYCYCRDADEHPDIDGQRYPNIGYRDRHRYTFCEHDDPHEHEHQDKLELDFHERVIHNTYLDVHDHLDRDVLRPRSTRAPNLDEHLDHTTRLLPYGLLRLLGRLRWGLLPDRPRLPGDVLPIYGIHHHYLGRRDDRRAPDGRPHHHLGGHLRRRVDHVPHGGGADRRVLPVRVQLRHGELFPAHGQRNGQRRQGAPGE